MEENKFSGWGLVEIMGHVHVAGRLGERSIAGTNLLQVDIPLSDEPDHFRTQFVGGGSIYALHPTDEKTARALAKRLGTKPTYAYDVEQQLRIEQRAAAEPVTAEPRVPVYGGDDPDHDHDEDDDNRF
jgi:hypothetical protein